MRFSKKKIFLNHDYFRQIRRKCLHLWPFNYWYFTKQSYFTLMKLMVTLFRIKVFVQMNEFAFKFFIVDLSMILSLIMKKPCRYRQTCLTLSWWRSLSYRNQSTYSLCKSMDWILYDSDLRHERFKVNSKDIKKNVHAPNTTL